MPLMAFALVAVSCAVHAFWNLLVKRSNHKHAFTTLFLASILLTFSPTLFILKKHMPPLEGWFCIFASGIIYATYFSSLAQAYSVSEMSFAYPFSRGLGPTLAVFWGIVLLGERPGKTAVLGIILVLAGAFVLHWHREARFNIRFLISPNSLPAWFAGVAYSFYSVIDKIAVSYVGVHPAFYIYATHLVCATLILPFSVWRFGKEILLGELRLNWFSCLAAGALNIVSYLLVLWAMSLPNTPISYIVPLRTLSVLFGVLLGTEVLGESGRWWKMGASFSLMIGMSLIAFS